MFKSVLNKIKNNIGMFICLVVGSLLITGIISCIPLYSNGMLKGMLATDLDNYEIKSEKPSGQMLFTAKLPAVNVGTVRADAAEEYKDRVLKDINKSGPKVLNQYVQVNAGSLRPDKNGDFVYSTSYGLSYVSQIKDHITVVQGRMYSSAVENDIIEVILPQEEIKNNPDVELGKVYNFSSSLLASGTSLKIKPVGVFVITNAEDDFWYDTDKMLEKLLLADQEAFESLLYKEAYSQLLTDISVYCNLDFRGMSIETLPLFSAYYNSLFKFASSLGTGKASVSLNCVSLVNSYIKKSSDMQLSLWVLNIPIIAMLALYMIMVTRMILDEDLNEISTFKSRGAKTGYIFARYVIECGILSLIAILLGPVLGFLMAKYIGAAAGFLDFTQKETLDVSLGFTAYIYALIACVIFAAMVLVPAIVATRKSIVNLKQGRARKSRLAWWEKSCMDVICLVVSIGLFFIYKRTDGFNADGTVDPVVYVISSLFILGCGLLFIRIYPFVIAAIFSPFKRILPASVYSAYTQVSRNVNDYRFLMLFLTMTLSVGIYSSGSARIINNTVEDSVTYKYGADVVISPDFSKYAAYEEFKGDDEIRYEYIPESFRSFPLAEYNSSKYIEAVSRVSYGEKLYIKPEGKDNFESKNYSFMAIDPADFGKVAECGNELNEQSFNTYLNILNDSPTAVLISRALAEKYEIEVGETLWLDINASNDYAFEYWSTMPCLVGGIVDYWPTVNLPAEEIGLEDEVYEKDGEFYGIRTKYYVIMNFEYLYSIRDTGSFKLFASIPDNMELSMDSFSEALKNEGLIDNSSQIEVYRPDKMREKKNDSMLKALNGCFSIGFISTLAVAFVGFVFFWIMNVRKRKLQFGILRAMGLTKGKLTLMLIWEHLLTTGVSVLVGTVVGAITVNIYAPLLKVAYSEGVLPLEVIFNRGDNIKIFAVVGLMLAAGIIVLSCYIGKLKINEAVKIGEE